MACERLHKERITATGAAGDECPKAYRAEDDQDDARQQRIAGLQLATVSEIDKLQRARQDNIDKTVAVLAAAQGHNPDAADLLKIVQP